MCLVALDATMLAAELGSSITPLVTHADRRAARLVPGSTADEWSRRSREVLLRTTSVGGPKILGLLNLSGTDMPYRRMGDPDSVDSTLTNSLLRKVNDWIAEMECIATTRHATLA